MLYECKNIRWSTSLPSIYGLKPTFLLSLLSNFRQRTANGIKSIITPITVPTTAAFYKQDVKENCMNVYFSTFQFCNSVI